MKGNVRGVHVCSLWEPLFTDQWDGVVELCIYAWACALVKHRLGNPRFCDGDRTACMLIAMAMHDRSFDMTTVSVDVFSLFLI